MSKNSKGSGGSRNDSRPNGKAWKQHKRTGREGATGKTTGGYSHQKATERAQRRATPHLGGSHVD